MKKFSAYAISPLLPWENGTKQDRIFLIILLIFLLLGVMLGFLIANLPYTQQSKEAREKIPERLATVLKRKKEVVPPPPKVVPQQSVKKDTPKKEEKKDVPKKKRTPKKVAKTEQEKRDRAAAQKKLNEALSLFADIQKLDVNVNTQSLSQGGGKARASDRKLITARAGSGSGGVAIQDNISASDSSGFAGNNGAGDELVAIATTQVESNIPTKRKSGGGADGKRSLEEIRKVFDSRKGVLFSLYSRALRKNPTIQGSIELHLVIQPDGSVSLCELVSSEIDDPDLIRKIISRVKTFNFGPDEVDLWDDNYTINLVPG